MNGKGENYKEGDENVRSSCLLQLCLAYLSRLTQQTKFKRSCSVAVFLIFFCNIGYRQPLKRCSSRWDQEAPKKYQRIEESVGPDHTHGDTNQKNREDRFLSEECHPVLLLNSQLKDSNSGQEERSTSDETGLESISKEISLDVKVTQFDKEGFSSSSGEGQDPNRFVTEIEKEVNTRRSSADEQKIFREAR